LILQFADAVLKKEERDKRNLTAMVARRLGVPQDVVRPLLPNLERQLFDLNDKNYDGLNALQRPKARAGIIDGFVENLRLSLPVRRAQQAAKEREPIERRILAALKEARRANPTGSTYTIDHDASKIAGVSVRTVQRYRLAQRPRRHGK
jgi:hypothetical protein